MDLARATASTGADEGRSGDPRSATDSIAADLPGGGWVVVLGASAASPEAIGPGLDAGSVTGPESGVVTVVSWDPTTPSLTLTRPLGSSPPVHFRVDGAVVSWSTRASDLVRPGDRLDPVAVAAFLQAGHITTRSTLVEGVERVAPGETVVLTPSGSRRCATATPDWPHEGAADRPTRLAAIREAFIVSLDEAVRGSHQPSLTLSGGIDSTMVAVGLRRYLGLRPTAFTVRFPGVTTRFDEFDAADLTARALGIDHEPMDLGPEYIGDHLSWMVHWFDAPFSYAVHTANLAPLSGHDVLVSGAGGDAFGLTSKERAGVALGRVVPRRVAPVALQMGMVLGSLGVRGSQRLRGTIVHASDLATAIVLDLESGRAFDVSSALLGRDVAILGRGRLVAYFRDRLAAAARLTPRQLRLHLWAHVVDPEDSVGWTSTWGDAYGIRARFPYLHPALGAALAEHAIDTGDRSEFRSLAAEHLPREAAYRPKIGQSLPLGDWFRTSLRDLVESVLASDAVGADGLVDPEATSALVRSHMAGSHDHRWDLLKLMTLLTWKRQVFDPATSVRR